MSDLLATLRKSPIIAGVKSVESARAAFDSGVGVLFFLAGNIFDLREIVHMRQKSPALVFAHVDLLQGIGKDAWGMRLLATELGVDGILTTRSHLTRIAKKEGLLAIQRIFVLDSEALKTGFSVLRTARPDAVEILPGLILPHIHQRIPATDLPPVIAGGLVETPDEVRAILKTSALAVSTSRESLWSPKLKESLISSPNV